jgi:outer membrane immunogenic protein
MKKLLGGIALTAFLAAPAMAADIPARIPVKAPPPVVVAAYSWSGCYIGIHGGGAWGNKRWYDATGFEFVDREHDVDGFLVGGQLGCNWQSGQWVFGIEGQAAWADVEGSVDSFGVRYRTEADILGSIAARIGWAFDRTLLYVKGGAAFAHEGHTIGTPGGVIAFEAEKELRWGWMVGAGLEYAFSGAWSGKIEYNYNNFGTEDISLCPVPGPGLCGTEQIKQHIHIVKVGINYRWGGGAVVARY